MVEIKATYENVPTGSTANSTTTGTYPYNYSTNFVNFNDFKSQRAVPKYATLELNRNLLDGTFINVPSNPSGYGYLSSIQSDEDGVFEDDIVITRTYTNTYASPRIEY